GGTEIALQGILRIEREFVAIKGRLAGSQDAGRVYFIPFTHIDYIGTQVEVKDAEFEAMFGKTQLSSAAVAPSTTPDAAVAPSATPAVPKPPPLPSNGQRAVPTRPAVLERFRSRNNSAPGPLARPPVNGINPNGSQLPG